MADFPLKVSLKILNYADCNIFSDFFRLYKDNNTIHLNLLAATFVI